MQWTLGAAGRSSAFGHEHMSSRLLIKKEAGIEFQKWGMECSASLLLRNWLWDEVKVIRAQDKSPDMEYNLGQTLFVV